MEFQEIFIVATSTIGFISLCKPIIIFLRWVWIVFLRRPKNLKDYGSWALITGSTDGIGKALAFEMASKGLNLVLVGRNPSKLEATSTELHEKYGGQIQVKNIVIDLAKFSGEEIGNAIEEGIKGLDVGILINNAGVAYPYARFFHEADLELMESTMKVNIEGATWVTKAVLPIMLKKKKGAIVNIGSASSDILPSYPLYTVYAASKAWVWVMFLRPPKNLKEYGSWALITGAADGIGRALAFEMAAKGLNLVLLDRNVSKLEATANEIHERFGERVEIKKIVMDLAKLSGEEIAKAIEEEIKGLDVGVLVNNAGVAYSHGKFFHEVDDLELMDSIKVNMEAATWITWVVLPIMLKKKKGAIVNIGSASSEILPSYPLYTVYAASKAYISMFSKSISLEYKKHGIDVQCQIPTLVATKMTKLKPSSFFVASPEMYSKASMRWIGYEHLCTPYWGHSVQWLIIHVLPDVLLNAIILRYFIGMRRRGQLKEAQNKSKQM